MANEFIPVSEPLVGELEAAYVAQAVQSGWISSAGEFLNRFESEWARLCDQKFGVAVANGTCALEIAVEMAQIGPGDEVIVPTLTIISCALAIVKAGAKPVFVDCDPQTWCMDTSQIEAKISPRTRAIMPVHIFGHPVQMDEVRAIATKHGLLVVEDAAEAHGALFLSKATGENVWRPCGSMGDVSTFSFYGNKLVSTGEGGMVLTNNPNWNTRARALRDLCHVPGQRFLHREWGHNYRFTNVAAALGCAQIERLPSTIEKRRDMGRLYTQGLQDVPGLQLPVEKTWARHVFWVYALQLSDDVPADAADFGASLKAQGVDWRPAFVPLHEQPVLNDMGIGVGESFPVAEKAARRAFYIPSGTPLTNGQIERVIEVVRGAMRELSGGNS